MKTEISPKKLALKLFKRTIVHLNQQEMYKVKVGFEREQMYLVESTLNGCTNVGMPCGDTPDDDDDPLFPSLTFFRAFCED